MVIIIVMLILEEQTEDPQVALYAHMHATSKSSVL